MTKDKSAEEQLEAAAMLKLIALREMEVAEGKTKSHKDVKKEMDALLAELSKSLLTTNL